MHLAGPRSRAAQASAIALSLASCQPSPPPPPTATVPVIALASAPPEPALSASAPPVIAAPAAPGTFRCGEGACRVGRETCCWDGRTGACVPTVPPGPDDQVQLLASQIEACSRAKLTYSLASLARCGDSGDCPSGEACCVQHLYGGAAASVCIPLSRSGDAACDLGEPCRPEVPCRARGAECAEGLCRKPSSSVLCGKATCAGASPACCGDPPVCQPAAACAAGPRYRCAGPRGCLDGEHCQATFSGTRCLRLLDVANAEVVCARDIDCPKALCLGRPGARPRCAPSGGRAGWLKTCSCP